MHQPRRERAGVVVGDKGRRLVGHEARADGRDADDFEHLRPPEAVGFPERERLGEHLRAPGDHGGQAKLHHASLLSIADQSHGRADRFEYVANVLQRVSVAGDDDRQVAGLDGHRVAGHGGAQVPDAKVRRAPGKPARAGDVDRAHLDEDRRERRATGERTVLAEQYSLYGRAVGQHRQNHVRTSGGIACGGRDAHAARSELLGRCRRPVVDGQVEAGVRQASCHRHTHSPKAEEGEPHHTTPAASVTQRTRTSTAPSLWRRRGVDEPKLIASPGPSR